MSDKPQYSEKRDANTVITAVNTVVAVANTAATIYSAKQIGKQPKEPPKK
jgi:hypothetical protein